MKKALLVALVLVALHAWYAGLVGLAEDEAYYWVWSRHPALGYFDHPPVIAWLIGAGTALLGDTERGVRLGAALLGGLAALATAGLARDRVVAVATLGTMPLMALGGTLATPDVPLVAAWALGILAASRGWWAAAGAAAGLAMLSKYTGVFLLPLLLLGARPSPRTRGPWIAAGVALLVYAPNAAWNLSHDLVSWRFQLDHVAASAQRLAFLGAQVGLAGPLLFGALAAWWAVAWRGDPVERLCWWASAPLLVVAVLAGGEANWAAPAFVGAVDGLSRRSGRWSRAAWAGMGVNAALSALVLVHAVHPLANLPADPTDRLRGGRILGEAVAAWGTPDVLTARYQEAALIEFYGHVPARAWPGMGRPDQYDLWSPPLPERGLFVRVWSASTRVAVEDKGYDHGGANVVTAYADTTDPRAARLVARWQVYEIWRLEPR